MESPRSAAKDTKGRYVAATSAGQAGRALDLAWLAGIIDGEGNLHALVQEKRSGSSNRLRFLCPKIRITNTDMRMIQRVSEIYVREGLTFFYALNRVSRYKNRQPTWKDQLEITVGSQAGVAKLLRLVLPYLVAKQVYASIFLELIEWVQLQPKRGRNSRATESYTDQPKFAAYLERLAQERAFYIAPSTTTLRAGESLVISSDLMRDDAP